ncbi:MAG: DctP family TRAP transporter solute-binding subunit [Hydrogenophaga sp.]|uniref:DctP family TRAP transporter solute-binding subunit n=1 Tax=Hydrogenophaga sp. TaxID=1904254 RepID=UPI003D14080B
MLNFLSLTVRTAVSAAVAIATFSAAHAQTTFPERNVRASLTLGKEHPLGIGLTKVVQCAAQRTGGKFKIQPFFDAALASGDGPALQQTRSGTIDMVVGATASVTAILPAAGVFDLPFMFNNEKEADQLLDGPVGELLASKLPSVGLVSLGYWEYGFRQTTNSRHAIHKMEDLQNLKMRVMPNPVIIDAFKNMGGFAMTLPMPELYTALETKTVDGQENPFSTIEQQKFFEVQKYLSLTKHMYNPVMVYYSKKNFDQLTPPEQAMLKDCVREGRDEQRRVNRQQNEQSLARLKERGMVVNEVSPTEIQRMRERSMALWERQASVIGPEMMNAVTAELKRIRAN